MEVKQKHVFQSLSFPIVETSLALIIIGQMRRQWKAIQKNNCAIFWCKTKEAWATDHPGLVIFDVYRGMCPTSVNKILQENNMLYVLVPANCTDQLQPLDLSIKKPAKEFLRHEFQSWYTQKNMQAT